MTKTLFDLTYEVAAEMGILQEGVCTGGSTNTIVDTVNLTQTSDYWNGGTAWIIYDAGGADAAPQGEMSAISDSSTATSSITVSTGWTTATAAGDRYAVALGGQTSYRLDQLKMAINRAVRDVGYIPVVDTTSIDTAANKTEYALPVAIKDLREVWIQSVTNDTNNNEWYKARNWEIVPGATGSGDTLIFQEQPAYTRDVMLKYVGPHPKLDIATDQLSEDIREERVIYKAAWYALSTYRFRTRDTDEYLIRHLDELIARSREADARFPVRVPKRSSKIMSPGYRPTRELAPGENKIT